MPPSAPAPIVSVCIPAFNAARFIGSCIESVLVQTCSTFELVIVDDASTDQTINVVGRYADPRIRLLTNDYNLGLAGNWNRAVAEARGRYVKLLCQDDLLYPDCLASQVAALEDPANAGVGIVCVRRDIVDETGRELFRDRGMRAGGRVGAADALRQVARSGTNPLGEPVAVMFRADTFARAGGFDASGRWPYMIDIDLWTRILMTAADLYCVPRTLGAFRVSRAALSTTLARAQSCQARHFFHDLARRAPGVVRPADLLVGSVRARALGVARRVLYRWMWRGRGT